jgi:hypothetical protein
MHSVWNGISSENSILLMYNYIRNNLKYKRVYKWDILVQ